MASQSLSFPTAHFTCNRVVQKLGSKVLLWPSPSHTKPRRISSSIRAMGSSASSHSHHADSIESEAGIDYTLKWVFFTFLFVDYVCCLSLQRENCVEHVNFAG